VVSPPLGHLAITLLPSCGYLLLGVTSIIYHSLLVSDSPSSVRSQPALPACTSSCPTSVPRFGLTTSILGTRGGGTKIVPRVWKYLLPRAITYTNIAGVFTAGNRHCYSTTAIRFLLVGVLSDGLLVETIMEIFPCRANPPGLHCSKPCGIPVTGRPVINDSSGQPPPTVNGPCCLQSLPYRPLSIFPIRCYGQMGSLFTGLYPLPSYGLPHQFLVMAEGNYSSDRLGHLAASASAAGNTLTARYLDPPATFTGIHPLRPGQQHSIHPPSGSLLADISAPLYSGGTTGSNPIQIHHCARAPSLRIICMYPPLVRREPGPRWPQPLPPPSTTVTLDLVLSRTQSIQAGSVIGVSDGSYMP